MKETELAKPVIAWLTKQHWEVYQEVQFSYGGGIADIVAVRHGILWIIETKTTFGFAVLNQASRWLAHYRSVAVPFSRQRDYRVALHYYRVGVIEVGEFQDCEVYEHIPAPLVRMNHERSKRYIDSLVELQKTYAEAGSRSGSHLTPYKNTMIEVRKIISSNPGCTVKYLYERLGKMHYGSPQSFKGNLHKALIDFEKDWCEVKTDTRPYTFFCKEISQEGLL